MRFQLISIQTGNVPLFCKKHCILINTRWTESNRYAVHNNNNNNQQQPKNLHTPHYDMPMTDNRLTRCVMYECECLSASLVTQHKRNTYILLEYLRAGPFVYYSIYSMDIWVKKKSHLQSFRGSNSFWCSSYFPLHKIRWIGIKYFVYIFGRVK